MESQPNNDSDYKEHPNTAISLRNQEASPLLRLPVELRNSVYELVFGGHSINLTRNNPPRWLSSKPSQPPFRTSALSLLFTCRQLHAESRLLPFALNPVFCDHGLNEDLISESCRLTPDQLDSISTAQVRSSSFMMVVSVGERRLITPFRDHIRDVVSRFKVRKLSLVWGDPALYSEAQDVKETVLQLVIEFLQWLGKTDLVVENS
ncbi:hypothetical protein T440DRAFT_84248 [Plenodomus tracheiphilus IPT5]|uniref:Uncharacterized protein n=1 Tax=Plenodomus tracheiphilus IPT5 TaxID=1408161 RepID=A0A6A7B651_9PLEO|nr:hypothetical protein T440DRAFT_84248 [Plenodomus tracheiphilus IPT5]